MRTTAKAGEVQADHHLDDLPAFGKAIVEEFVKR